MNGGGFCRPDVGLPSTEVTGPISNRSPSALLQAGPAETSRTGAFRSALGFHAAARPWLELGIAFGAATSELWNVVAELAERFGDGEVRLTPSRRVLVCGVRERDQAAALRIAASAGLIIDSADPLLRAVACPGAPACSSAHGETRELARELAPLLAAGETLHVSGCAKGCARSEPSDVVLVRDDRHRKM